MLYPVTPVLSVEALQERLICEDDIAVAFKLDGTVGGVVSGTALLTVTLRLPLVAEFPAPSLAIALSVCTPGPALAVSHVNTYGATIIAAPIFALSN